MSKRKIRWDKAALLYFSEAIGYIRKDSAQNADKVKNDVLSMIRALASSPEIHAPENINKTIVASTGLLNYIGFVLLT